MPGQSESEKASELVVTNLVAKRWTKPLAAKGWVPIANVFLNNYSRLYKKISPTEAMIIVHLMQHKWDDKMPFPSMKRLGRLLGLSATSVRNYVRQLETNGSLVRVRRQGRSNEFDLTPLFQRLEACLEPVPVM